MLSDFPIRKLNLDEIPPELLEIPEAPKELYIRGNLPQREVVFLSVVGSRKYTPYGKEACRKLIEGLQGYNICIVSGLALGIDTIAHEAALSAGIKTVAIPGSGLSESVLYPKTNISLAKRILEAGGALLSELREDESAAPWTFPRRNRIMAGLSKAILVIEAEKISGTLITARLATEYNRDVLAVPGSIFSSTSEGPLGLIRLGATPISSSEDILDALQIVPTQKTDRNLEILSEEERKIVTALTSPLGREELLEALGTDVQTLGINLTLLEIKNIIQEVGGKIYLK